MESSEIGNMYTHSSVGIVTIKVKAYGNGYLPNASSYQVELTKLASPTISIDAGVFSAQAIITSQMELNTGITMP